MFDFNGLLLQFQQNLDSSEDVRQYATLMWKATSENNHEFFNNHVNPYPITITYYGQDKNQLLEWSMFDYKTYTFNDKIYEIEPEYFVETLVVASNVKSIPNEMFQCLVALKTVTFESGSILEHMGNSCFADCHSLQHINLPHTVKTLGLRAFKNCFWLSTVNMDSCNVVQICEKTFLNCYNLKRISFPSSLKSIQDSSFNNCSGLSHVSLPEYFETFDRHVMIGCSSLKVLYLPSNIDPDYFNRKFAYRLHEGYRSATLHPLFDEDLILLFDRVDGVQWGTSASTFDGELIYRDAHSFPHITPFISLLDIGQHIQSMKRDADPSVEMNWLGNNSDGFRVAVHKYQMSILHILCHFPSNCDQVCTCVNELMHKCPLMIECKDNTGRTALHHLIEFNPRRHHNVVKCVAERSNGTVVFEMIRCKPCETDVKLDIIECIVSANDEALKCEDEETGLMSFMFACMGEEYNLSVAYKLLQKMPDYFKNV